MKNITIITLIFFFSLNTAFAQNINWKFHPDSTTSLIHLNLGYDFGMTTQLGYAYKLNTNKPIFLKASISIPMGKNILDDYKFNIGGQIALVEKNNFILAAAYNANLKRYETNFVRQIGIGNNISITPGYYKPKWHLAANIGFEQFVATHLKQGDIMRENYTEVQDGWFSNTGGQLYFGVEGSKTIGKRMALNLSLGTTNAFGDDVDALLPAYLGIGLNYRFLE